MESTSNVPSNDSSNSVSAAAADNPPQAPEEQQSSPVPSMSGALQGGDVKDLSKATDDNEGMFFE